MRSSLADSVGGIRAAAASVRESAQRIEGGSSELAGRTEQQASGLEETASSMEEFTATVQQNADSAGRGSTLALQASDAAARGGEAVRAVVRTMEGIQQSSGRIGEIIGVIDGIAFQTNILALNAAVEAARAGDQGRGFAVVAGEVRALAQRSAQAAREIKGLIGESAGRVGEGVREVASAGATMDGVVGSVQQVSRIVADIALASREQLAGIQQVNSAIAHMDGHTQQNAVLVEQAASAAADLARQAEALVRAVARFRLEEDKGAAPPSAGERHAPLPAPPDAGAALLAPAMAA
jgi:methyl-accepting chemotaxis protein